VPDTHLTGINAIVVEILAPQHAILIADGEWGSETHFPAEQRLSEKRLWSLFPPFRFLSFQHDLPKPPGSDLNGWLKYHRRT
jgi:hypothetical protein